MTKKNIGIQNDIILIEYDKAFESVKEEIERALSSAPVIIRKYTEHLSNTTGKFIRAAALLSCAENNEGLISPDAVKMASAVELFHLATLVHDDVIDNANIRRGEITLQKKYGKRTAVICGDYVFCIALKLASEVTNREDYAKLDMPDYIGRVCLGELNQHIHNSFLDLSIHQYLKIISGKTAALFEASFFAGAIINGVKEQDISKYKRLGRNIGMIFQITDDCMDFETTEHVAKKPIQSDYEQGVITLPLIYAFKNLENFKEKARNNKLTRNEINTAVERSKGLEHARKLSRRYYDKSLQIINGLDITAGKKDKLLSILDRAYRVF
jgi:Geranylgeranyl pyrophosphate synthase